MRKKVISIGQCGYDNSQIGSLFSKLGADFTAVDLNRDLYNTLSASEPDLVLINRVNDSDGSSGIALIKELKGSKEYSKVPLLLVSNYEDAQKEAVALGALPGFGKSELASPTVSELIKNYLSN